MLFVNFPVGLIVWIVYAIVYQQIENYVIAAADPAATPSRSSRS